MRIIYKDFITLTNLINFLISLMPFSLILGNLIINTNIVLICLLGLFLYGKQILIIDDKIIKFLIFSFFSYIILITSYNNIPHIFNNELYAKHFYKSFFYLRFLFCYLVINKLIEENKFNLKLFIYSCAFFSFIVAFDIIFQVIFEKNLIGNPITANRPSSFFGEEHIAGGYLQKFILFFLFLIISKNKNELLNFLLFIIFFIPIILTANRMPAILYVESILIFYFLEKNLKKIILFILFMLGIFFLFIKFPIVNRIDQNLNSFLNETKNIVIKAPKLFYYNSIEDNKEADNFGSTGYIVQFNSGVQTWKNNKIFGQGLRSFPLKCKFGKNEVCSSHPHNYFIEIMLDVGIIGLILIYSLIIYGVYKYLIFFKIGEKFTIITLPFFLIILLEFFPFRASGSFFSTGNSSIIFLILPILFNIKKLEKFI